jgi:hypothetical protein
MFAFLVKSCVNNTCTTKCEFWNEVIVCYYKILDINERFVLFNKVVNSPNFDIDIEGCSLFYDRYNPKNKYRVTFLNETNEKIEISCFEHHDEFRDDDNVLIDITKISNIVVIYDKHKKKHNRYKDKI